MQKRSCKTGTFLNTNNRNCAERQLRQFCKVSKDRFDFRCSKKECVGCACSSQINYRERNLAVAPQGTKKSSNLHRTFRLVHEIRHKITLLGKEQYWYKK